MKALSVAIPLAYLQAARALLYSNTGLLKLMASFIRGNMEPLQTTLTKNNVSLAAVQQVSEAGMKRQFFQWSETTSREPD